MKFTDTIAPVATRVVGRRRELETIVAVLAAGRDVILEGPPGTSKTTLLREIAAAAAVPLEIVEGAPDLLPAKLVGSHDPALVLGQGYQPDAFVEGPLLRAMRDGGILYIEEFNRIPEDVTNVLIRAMSERRIVVPRMGEFGAVPSFRVIAAMNPYDDTGTERVSRAIGDRFCKVRMTYQSEQEERSIVHLRVSGVPDELVTLGVAISRRSRQHPHVRMGASVRGAMDFAAVTAGLLSLRGCAVEAAPPELLLEGALAAFSSKIWMAATTEVTVEDVLREILAGLLGLEAAALRAQEEPGPPGGVAGAGGKTEPTAGSDGGQQQARPLPDGGAGMPLATPAPRLAAATADENSPLAAHRRFIAMAGPRARPVLRRDALKEIESALHLAERITFDHRLFLSRRRGCKGPLRCHAAPLGAGEVDIEATLEQWGAGVPRLAVLARSQQPRSFSLMLDVSGSMAGASLVSATVMAAVLAQHLRQLEHAVIAFSERAVTLKGLRARVPTATLLRRLTRLRALGTTNISSGLSEGLLALASSHTHERIGILVTDGAHNHMSDPARIAAGFPRLHVIAYRPPWQRARSLCDQLAACGQGVCVVVHDLEQMPHAVARCLQQ